jgi:threonine/homoserine/homoserine lactone efflux protein
LNHYFSKVALRLNDSENYRTNVLYEDALITKAFIFQFLNSFASLFYVAFMKPFNAADACIPAYCFVELQVRILLHCSSLSCFPALLLCLLTYLLPVCIL